MGDSANRQMAACAGGEGRGRGSRVGVVEGEERGPAGRAKAGGRQVWARAGAQQAGEANARAAAERGQRRAEGGRGRG
jgi:hypothetical protein